MLSTLLLESHFAGTALGDRKDIGPVKTSCGNPKGAFIGESQADLDSLWKSRTFKQANCSSLELLGRICLFCEV